MNYYEVEITYNSPIDHEVINDLLAGVLVDIDFESFSPQEAGVLAYCKETDYQPDKLQAALDSFPLEGLSFAFKATHIKTQNWNEEWEKNYFKPIEIWDQCLLHASFHQTEKVFPYDIIIDPKMAFGTGNHETTRLMLEYILETPMERCRVLDMGCGTAVLGILAAMKRASQVVAIDIDDWAYENALENIRLNNTPHIQVLCGGAEQIPADICFDIILANINRNILLNDIPLYAKSLKKGGMLFMSGFYVEDRQAISDTCSTHGLTLTDYKENNRWTAVKAFKG